MDDAASPFPRAKVLLTLTAGIGPVLFVQGQMFHYGQLEALRAPLSLFPLDLQESWMQAYQCYLRLLSVLGDTMGEVGAWLVPTAAAITLVTLFLMVLAFRVTQRVERPLRRWWWRFDWSQNFRVLMAGWARMLCGGVMIPAVIFYALIVVLFFGGLSYLVGQYSIAQYRKDLFRGFPEIETAGPPHGAGVTRLFECRGDFCLLIRNARAIVVPRNQLDGRTILGRPLR